MSDISGLVAIGPELNLDEVRSAVLEGLAKTRLQTILNLSGAYTLNGDADLVLADLTSAAFEVTLPAAPVDGDRYEFMKVDASGNALTVGRNGKNINGVASNVSVSTQWASKVLTWSATLNSWVSR